MISTHVLDTARGHPAAGLQVVLERVGAGGAADEVARGLTDGDGRIPELLPRGTMLEVGDYRLSFATAEYFARTGTAGFYPTVSVVFTVRDALQHHHVPLLLSPYGFSTYRGT